MNRSQKIHNIDLALALMSKDFPDVKHTPVYTALEGPHINITTAQFEAKVTVEFEGSIVKFNTYGYVHRFADLPKFISFFQQTVKTPNEAIAELAHAIGGKTMGDAIVLRSEPLSYYIHETSGGYTVHANNDKIFMSGDDIKAMLGA